MPLFWREFDFEIMDPIEQKIEQILTDKSEQIAEIFSELRAIIVLHSEHIIEELKWGMPHYNYKGMMIGLGAFKNHVVLWFHKGILINDSNNLFEPSADSKGMLSIKFLATTDIDKKLIKKYVDAAMEINEKGLKVGRSTVKKSNQSLVLSDDFAMALRSNEIAQDFFDQLAPSHKKGFAEWIANAKRETTKINRISRAISRLEKGFKTTH